MADNPVVASTKKGQVGALDIPLERCGNHNTIARMPSGSGMSYISNIGATYTKMSALHNGRMDGREPADNPFARIPDTSGTLCAAAILKQLTEPVNGS